MLKNPFLLVIISFASLLLGIICIYLVRDLSFSKVTVVNVSDKNLFTDEYSQRYQFIPQDKYSVKLLTFKRELVNIFTENPPELKLLENIRHWARDQQGDFSKDKWRVSGGKDLEDPLQSLREQRNGVPGACRRFAYILVGALTSANFTARIAHIASDFSDSTFNHTLVEVWSNSLQKWLLIDSDYDTFYMVNNKYASLFEVFRAVKDGKIDSISFERNGSIHKPTPLVYNGGEPSLLISSFKHIYVSNTDALFDGYSVIFFGEKRILFMHYTEEGTPQYPELKKKVMMIFSMLLPLTSLVTAIMSLLAFSKRQKRQTRTAAVP